MRQLVMDVGNTETAVGIVDEPSEELAGHWRLSTVVPRTPDEYGHLLGTLLERAGFEPSSVDRAVVASVVPRSTEILRTTLERLVDGPVVVVTAASGLPIRLDVEEPLTVGPDRIVNTLAAKELYARDTVVVDLGTATTYDCITADGVFVGGVISPGIEAGLEWLGRRTAMLPRVEMVPPARCIGRRTETCIQSGIFFSVVDAVDGMVRRIREEWERPGAWVVATGGFAPSIAPHTTTVDHAEPFLTLRGLALAGEMLG